MIRTKIAAVLLLISFAANAQDLNKQDVKNEVIRILDSINKAKLPDTKSGVSGEEHWYDRISLRGYAQIRYNGLFSTNDKVSCEQCDKSWGTTSTAPDASKQRTFYPSCAFSIFRSGSPQCVFLFSA